jgi:hypothetical protein
MVQIKFTTFGATSASGSFGPGDVLRCSPEMARHLVEDAKCAKYVEAQQPAPAAPVAEEAPKRGRKAK